MNDGDPYAYPCVKCGRSLDGIWGNAHLPFCSDCWTQHGEPRMSVSEAHLAGLLREARADELNRVVELLNTDAVAIQMVEFYKRRPDLAEIAEAEYEETKQ